MTLSCDCSDGYGEYAYWYETPDDFTTLVTTRARKCRSCKAKIRPGDTVAAFTRWRNPVSDIEDRIYGEGGEVPLATWYMCERCGGLFFAVQELGMCCDIDDDMAAQIKEYREMTALQSPYPPPP